MLCRKREKTTRDIRKVLRIMLKNLVCCCFPHLHSHVMKCTGGFVFALSTMLVGRCPVCLIFHELVFTVSHGGHGVRAVVATL